MKTAGLVLLAIGLLMTIYTGYQYVTRDTIVDMGPVEITKEEEHGQSWSPIIGIAIMIVGGSLLVAGGARGRSAGA